MTTAELPRPVLAWALMLTVVLWSGCASAPPAAGWHSLVPPPAALSSPRSVPPAVATLPADPGAGVLGVAAVTLPAEVDRPQLVLRFADNRVLLAEDERWLEPLKQQLPRALVLALSQRSGRPVVQTLAGSTVSHRLTVEVQRFELRPDDAAVLRAAWTLAPAAGSAGSGAPLVRVFHASVPATAGVAGSVDAMRRAIEQLADEIAAAAGSPA